MESAGALELVEPFLQKATVRALIVSSRQKQRLLLEPLHACCNIGRVAPILHDMLEDPLEDHNIAADHPEIVKRLNPYLSPVTYGTTNA